MAHSYIFDRMLGEFAAAAVVFVKAMGELEDDGHVEIEDEILGSTFIEHVERILHESHPNVFPYYSHCLNLCHKYFVWTGPKVEILRRSEEIISVAPLMTIGEALDHPDHLIYSTNEEDPTAPTSPTTMSLLTKRHNREDSGNILEERFKKHKRHP